MHVHLDHHSGEAIWRQIVEQIKYAVAAGDLHSGEQLPSIRSLAADLKINPRTVVKAYEELAHLGVISLQQGRGAFVDDRPSQTSTAVRSEIIRGLGRRLMAEAIRMGATPAEVLEELRAIAEDME